jgi:hypothetical protein
VTSAAGLAGTAALRARLRHVYWLGGGSGAGKSTISRRIAARHGLSRYATDDVMADHGSRCSAEDTPFLSQFAAMDMDQRWVNRPPDIMLETFHWYRGTLWEIAGKTSNPERALRNLLERDRMFTECLRAEASGLGLPLIEVDTAMTEDDLYGRVTEALAL